jgi:hypothetical protein
MFRKLRAVAIFAILMAPLSAHSLEIASPIATIGSASTDGSPSASVFELSVQSSVLPTGLTTTTDFSLSLTLRPQAADITKNASVYTVIVASNQFFKLEPDGSYAPWDGAAETLTPFVTNQMLSSTQTLTLLDGTMTEAGDYLYYAAYSIEGETKLHFTPEPAQISVKASTELPNNTTSQAAVTFKSEVETAIVQTLCIACHVEGGFARNSALQFQRTNTASALNNFGALSTYVEEKGSDLLLAKIAGEQGHAGGVQLALGGEGYQAIQKVTDEIGQLGNMTNYAFSGSENIASPRQASFLTGVTLESRQATLRRATLLMQGRIPTASEKNFVVSDSSLRIALRNLMSGLAFREFIVTGVNDRLLTQGTLPINDTVPYFLKYYSQIVENRRQGDIQDLMSKSLRRTSGELVAHVIEKDLPYSEILTAKYMMMNPFLNHWLEGTATFSNTDGPNVFKPSITQGYYFRDDLEEVEFHTMSNSTYRATGETLKNFPHTGLLSDFGFIARYPTTATNRNRARARWTFYHFLGIDIEKTSQRPTDEAALSDLNNPTMNNPNCTTCHALLDPVAGAFQNWDEENYYRSTSNDGSDALDGFYKSPQDGTSTPYQPGDLWYRDMREPGLFGKKITSRDNSLQGLAELIVSEPLFLSASAAFWWPAVFGKQLLTKPAVETDNNYAAQYLAYQAQQAAITAFADKLAIRMNAKDMLVEMFMSAWFSAETVSGYTFDSAHYQSKFGGEQLLTPEQLARKTRKLTGVAWRTQPRPSGAIFSDYEELSVLLGGIDSKDVTTRVDELTPLMTSVLMTHASESACIAVARQFSKSIDQRSLFSLIEESTLPLQIGSSSVVLPSEREKDWKTVSLTAELRPGPKTISIEFTNPWCDWDGSRCREQRILFLDSVTVISPSGTQLKLRGDDQRLYTISNDGNQNCHQGADGYGLCYSGIWVLNIETSEAGKYIIEASMSSQLTPSQNDYLELSISISADEDIFSASTVSASKIRQQISFLFEQLHGTTHKISSDQITLVYEIFATALLNTRNSLGQGWQFGNCELFRDGFFYQENLTAQEMLTLRTIRAGYDSYINDWDWGARQQYHNAFTSDSFGSKYAWTAVMLYMLSHYDYLHE